MPFYSQAYLDAHRAQLERSHLSVGWHPTLRDEFHVSETDRRTGFYISGTTGYGKSGLLRRLIHEDARRGNAVIVLDPNHDLVMDVLAELPESCLSRTYLLNMKDEEYPFGVNVFAVGKLKTSSERTQAVERLVHIFDVLWPDVTKQQNLPLYLRTTAIAMLANQGKTMVDMLNFLTKTPFREAMLQHVTDPMTLDFWEEPGRGDGDTRVTPLVNRLRSLFMGRELVRNIVGQARNSISFRRSIEGREIILIDLPLADLGEDAKLVGTLLLAQIYAAVFSFADTPPEQRPGVSLYVDECFRRGTPVLTPTGYRPIETIQVGDEVMTAFGTQRVLKTFQRKVDKLYKVRLSNGMTMEVTGNHPVFTSEGWRRVSELSHNSVLLPYFDVRRIVYSNGMPHLWETEAKQEEQNLFELLWKEASLEEQSRQVGQFTQRGAQAEGGMDTARMHNLRQDGQVKTTENLLSEVRQNMGLAEPSGEMGRVSNKGASAAGSAEEACSSDEKPQPSGTIRRVAPEGSENAPAYGPSTTGTLRQRFTNAGASQDAAGSARGRLVCGTRRGDQQGTWDASLLQNRYRQPESDDCCRSGWPLSRREIAQGTGSQERYLPKLIRVESIEVQEQTSDGAFAGSFDVYNLHVDGHPSYVVADVLVHNCQNFATVDFVKFFTEGRKYGIRTTVAHQYRDQLPDFLQSATKSTGVKLCFRLNADDAKEMAQYFPANEKVIKPEDIDPHVTETFLVRASDYGPMVEMFVDGFLQPLQRYRRGRGKVEIVNGGFDGRAVALGMMSGGQTSGPIQVDDPTYFLDRLFYDVMRTGDWRLPIPWEIPRGLANAGKGFFAAARGAKEWELGPEIMERFPANLVMPTGDGDYRWMRQPESSKETFYFLLFCLRSVMRQLSEEPIGKESVANAAETAKMLTQLPKRAAFIRAGDHGGTIYTHDTPPQVSEYEQERRYQLVQQRTRLKYCHPREDVEQALLNQRSAAPQRPVAPSPALEGEPVLMPYDEV